MRNLASRLTLAIHALTLGSVPACAIEALDTPWYVDPDYVGCLIAVDDADITFRFDLQQTCLQRMMDMCDLLDKDPSDRLTVECLNRENRQSIQFILAVTEALPSAIKGEGFTAAMYGRRFEDFTDNLPELSLEPEPEELLEAMMRTVKAASAWHMVLWLARKSGTDVGGIVAAAAVD